ncbi:MAG: NADH-quinone oxidoreductase subunit J [Deltaproteobacteria bacterium]|nr:NADH-quinone oxidoreductase subunit J [Deltaproteobacteria bacterium]
MIDLLFWIFSGAAIGSAVLVVTLKDPVQSVMSLVITFFSLAAIFVLLDAHFLAAAQIIVYAGAILVLVTFVIMLLDLRAGDITGPTRMVAGRFLGVGAAAALFMALWSRVVQANLDRFPELTEGHGTVERIARVILIDNILPFETVSVLLLVATVGAVWIARREDT